MAEWTSGLVDVLRVASLSLMGMVPFLARSSFLFSSVFLSVPCDIAQAFQFSAPKRTTSEICILPVSGGVIAKGLTDQARSRLKTMVDANQQALVHAVYRKIEIPNAVWGDAVEERAVSTSPGTTTRGRSQSPRSRTRRRRPGRRLRSR